MNALQLAARVAAHPVLVKLRQRQEMMRRLMVTSYGHEFMSNRKTMILPNGNKSPRYAGVHFWTPAQCEEWFALENRMRAARKAIREVYLTA